jgi:hypothetical protein
MILSRMLIAEGKKETIRAVVGWEGQILHDKQLSKNKTVTEAEVTRGNGYLSVFSGRRIAAKLAFGERSFQSDQRDCI